MPNKTTVRIDIKVRNLAQAGLRSIQNTFRKMRDVATGAAAAISQRFSSLSLKGVSDKFRTLVSDISSATRRVGSVFAKNISNGMKRAAAEVKVVGTGMAKGIHDALKGVSDDARETGAAIAKNVSAGMKRAAAVAKSAGTTFQQNLQTAFAASTRIATRGVGQIQAAVNKISFAGLQTKIQGAVTGISRQFARINFSGFQQRITDAANSVRNKLANIDLRGFQQRFAAMATAVSRQLGRINLSGLKQRFDGVVTAIQSRLAGINLSGFRQRVADAMGAVSRQFARLDLSGLKDKMVDAGQAVSRAFGRINLSGLQSRISAIADTIRTKLANISLGGLSERFSGIASAIAGKLAAIDFSGLRAKFTSAGQAAQQYSDTTSQAMGGAAAATEQATQRQISALESAAIAETAKAQKLAETAEQYKAVYRTMREERERLAASGQQNTQRYVRALSTEQKMEERAKSAAVAASNQKRTARQAWAAAVKDAHSKAIAADKAFTSQHKAASKQQADASKSAGAAAQQAAATMTAASQQAAAASSSAAAAHHANLTRTARSFKSMRTVAVASLKAIGRSLRWLGKKGFQALWWSIKFTIKQLDRLRRSIIGASTSARLMRLASALGVGLFIRKIQNASDTVERLRLRMNALFVSAGQGRKAMGDMVKFATTVPFTLEEIMQAGTTLSVVMKNGAEELKQMMPIMADLAAVSGLTLREVSGQLVRMFSAGAAAADLFRERGILAMLGIRFGVKYTADETKRILQEAYESETSRFRGAAQDLAKTWSGLISMMQDRIFLFFNAIGNSGFYDSLKGFLRDMVQLIDQTMDDGRFYKFANSISDFLRGAGAAVASFLGKVVTVLDNIVKFGKAAFAWVVDIRDNIGAGLQLIGATFENIWDKLVLALMSWSEPFLSRMQSVLYGVLKAIPVIGKTIETPLNRLERLTREHERAREDFEIARNKSEEERAAQQRLLASQSITPQILPQISSATATTEEEAKRRMMETGAALAEFNQAVEDGTIILDGSLIWFQEKQRALEESIKANNEKIKKSLERLSLNLGEFTGLPQALVDSIQAIINSLETRLSFIEMTPSKTEDLVGAVQAELERREQPGAAELAAAGGMIPGAPGLGGIEFLTAEDTEFFAAAFRDAIERQLGEDFLADENYPQLLDAYIRTYFADIQSDFIALAGRKPPPELDPKEAIESLLRTSGWGDRPLEIEQATKGLGQLDLEEIRQLRDELMAMGGTADEMYEHIVNFTAMKEFHEKMSRMFQDLIVNGIGAFGDAISESFESAITGAENWGKAMKGAFLGAIASTAKMMGDMFMAYALASVGLSFIPGLQSAGGGSPWLFAAAAGMYALAGVAGGLAKGGADATSGTSEAEGIGPVRGETTIVFQDGFINLSDPRQRAQMQNMIETLGRTNSKIVVRGA